MRVKVKSFTLYFFSKKKFEKAKKNFSETIKGEF